MQAVQRTATPDRKLNYYQPKPWVWVAYYISAGYFVVNGVFGVISAIASTHQKIMGEEMGFGPGTYIAIAFALLSAFVGIGLMLRLEIARGIANFFCGMRIILDLACGGFTVLSALMMGPYGVLIIVMAALDIASAGFMLYLIGETDQQARV